MKGGILAFCALALGAIGAPALAQTALQNGAPVQFTLPGQNYVSNYYVDVDASVKQLRITATGSNSAADIDLFVRYGTPFPVANSASYPTSPQQVSEDTLARWSQYHAISSAASETINVLPGGHVPLTAGRWYIAVINANTTASPVTLSATTYGTPQVATIAVDFNNPGTGNDACDVTPWNDTTVVPASGGNPGTTLGQQRRNALTYAVQQLSQTLQPPVAVTVRACWDHLGGDKNSAVVAQAMPVTFLLDEPAGPGGFTGYSLERRYTWYAITEAVRESGTSQCGLIGGDCNGSGNEEIKATFNADIGSATVIGGEPFYYGYTSSAGASIDFISTAMHEITHGLGFLGLANTDDTLGPIGAKAGISSDGGSIDYQNLSQGPYDDVFDVNAAILQGNAYTPFMGYEVNGSGDSARAAAMVSLNGLRWSDAAAVDSNVNQLKALAAPQSFPLLYAPNPISNGSTLSHTAQSGDLMNAKYNGSRTMGLAGPMLAPLGWAASVAAPSFGEPIPSNWYDVSHSGHGFDFQRVARDPLFGDSYILVFYSFDASGAPEWYFAQGNLVDGVFVAGLDSNGNSLLYSTYGANHGVGQLQLTQQNIAGSVSVDFNQASQSPACRNVDRSATPRLAVMNWTISTQSDNWCMQPLVDAGQHPAADLSGHWYAPGDGGWGMEILDIGSSASSATGFVLVYYPDANGKPTWAVAQGPLTNGALNLPLVARTNGYCRTCAPPDSTQTSVVGNITLNLTAPAGTARAAGTATFTLNYPGGGGFSRTNEAITTLSLAPGQ